MENPRGLERAYNKKIGFQAMDLSGNAFKPELINLQDEKGEIIKDNLERWEFLKKTHTVHEIFEKLLLELFLVHHPELKPKPG